MGLFSRFGKRRRGAAGQRTNADTPAVGSRAAERELQQALEHWTASRRGVEAFVEPRTSVTENTILLVAHDGEFTRRRVASPSAARELARGLGIPIYDATVVGYPQRMRDYTRRQKLIDRRKNQ